MPTNTPVADREGLIALLEKLGSADDAEALAAARAVDARIKGGGLAWDDILARNGADDEAAAEEAHEGDPIVEGPVGDTGADLELIDRLLTQYEVSADTREMLGDLKEDIKQGEFTAADRHYLHGLLERLGKPAKKK